MHREPIVMYPIGTVRTDVPDQDVPRRRRQMVSRVELDPRLEPALDGIEAYSHLIVLFWMDRVRFDWNELRTHPRGDPALPLTGVLAGRGPRRPNPIGLAVVELLERAGPVLTVRRLDAWDGTPVLDIKPYDHYDVVPEPREPAWLAARR